MIGVPHQFYKEELAEVGLIFLSAGLVSMDQGSVSHYGKRIVVHSFNLPCIVMGIKRKTQDVFFEN